MSVHQILGLQVLHCQVRRKYRTAFHDQKDLKVESGGSLLFLTGGKAVFRSGETSFQAEKGDLVFWNSDKMSEFYPLPGGDFSYYVLTFKLLGPDTLLKRPEPDFPPYFKVRNLKSVQALFQAIYKTHRSHSPYRMQDCSVLGIRLLRLLDRNRIHDGLALQTPVAVMDPRINETLSFINAHFKERLKVRDLAGRVSMHPVHFTRLFTRTTRISPQRYILEKKIQKAKDFITYLDDNPDGASLEMGFHDYSHFYRTFKRLTGQTPSQYVKRYRKTQSQSPKGCLQPGSHP